MTFFSTFWAVILAVFFLRAVAMILQSLIYREAFKLIRETNAKAQPGDLKVRWCYRTRCIVSQSAEFGRTPLWAWMPK